MSKHIKVIVALDYPRFIRMCRTLKLNPHMVKYVNVKDVDKGLRGYYGDDIYPDGYGEHDPYAPDTDEVETDSTSNDDNYCAFCGEELDTNSNGYIVCRNCGYDEEYERGKLG